MPQTMKDRTKFIGGSDLGAVFNLPPYGCRRRLWYEKTGVASDYPFIESGPMRRGKFFEPIVRKFYQEQTGLTVEPGPIQLVDPDRPFSAGELDGRVKDNGSTRPWECKVPGERMFIKVKREGMQDDYILQLQKYIKLDNASSGTYAVFHADSVNMLTFDIERDNGIIEEIAKAEISFWKQVTEGQAPDRLDPSDRRCAGCLWRTSCQGAALLQRVKDTGDLITDTQLDPLMAEYTEAKTIHDEATELLDGVKDRIKDYLGDDVTAVQTTGNRIYFRPQVSKRWDTKALAKDHPDLAEKYKKDSVSRPLRIFFT